MAWKTLRELTADVINNLSQAGGVGSQRYAEPRIELLLNQCFEMLLDRQWWPQLMEWFLNCPLDGTTGVVTTDISAITRFEDIRAVLPAGSDRQLARLPLEINPGDIPAGQLTFIDSSSIADKAFRVFSATTTGNLTIHARLKPATFTANDEVKFDSLALVYGAAWAYAEDDGTNPGAAQKFQLLFENRVSIIEAMLNDKPIALNKRATFVPNSWWVA
jgi:hypothetical protein